MLVGIQIDQYRKFSPFLQKYEDILDYNNIAHVRLDISESDFWEKIRDLTLFVFRWTHSDWSKQLAHTILPIIENEMKIKCFPNQATCWHYDDKIRQFYLLKQAGFPIIDSYIFWDKIKALKWAENADYPVIFKLKGGAGSQNVILIKNKSHAIQYIQKMFGKGVNPNKFKFTGSTYKEDFGIYKKIHKIGGNILRKYRGEDISSFWQIHKNYVLFQKFLPDNDYDTRVTVIGDRAFAFRRFNRKNDFRSSGSGNLDVNPGKIDIQHVKIASEISKKMGFQSMAYDFLYDEKGSSGFCEISYTYVDWVVHSCPGYWDSNLNWHEGHYWPQYCHLMDTLEMPNLRQPEM
jgi:glutathione synthase/RimK-type ligase-like ATP-grasp enzyme